MSSEDVGDWSTANAAIRNFARSALILAGSILAIAAPLCLLSIATGQTGSGAPAGVVLAALVCLLAGCAAEAAGGVVQRVGSPLAAMLAGMGLRLMPPLVVCLVLAARGDGRQHLAFVVYLLAFYFVTLALDTWWAVQRVAAASPHSNHPSL